MMILLYLKKVNFDLIDYVEILKSTLAECKRNLYEAEENYEILLSSLQVSKANGEHQQVNPIPMTVTYHHNYERPTSREQKPFDRCTSKESVCRLIKRQINANEPSFNFEVQIQEYIQKRQNKNSGKSSSQMIQDQTTSKLVSRSNRGNSGYLSFLNQTLKDQSSKCNNGIIEKSNTLASNFASKQGYFPTKDLYPNSSIEPLSITSSNSFTSQLNEDGDKQKNVFTSKPQKKQHLDDKHREKESLGGKSLTTQKKYKVAGKFYIKSNVIILGDSCTKKINLEKISKDSRKKVICGSTWLEKTKDDLTQLEEFVRKYKPDHLIIQTRVDKLPSNYPTEITQRSMDQYKRDGFCRQLVWQF